MCGEKWGNNVTFSQVQNHLVPVVVKTFSRACFQQFTVLAFMFMSITHFTHREVTTWMLLCTTLTHFTCQVLTAGTRRCSCSGH